MIKEIKVIILTIACLINWSETKYSLLAFSINFLFMSLMVFTWHYLISILFFILFLASCTLLGKNNMRSVVAGLIKFKHTVKQTYLKNKCKIGGNG